MNLKRILSTVIGIFLFVSGIIISLILSGNLLWGELEARLYTQQSGEANLDIQCPLMIAPKEVATISAVITNTLTYRDTKPQVNAYISNEEDVRVVSKTLELAPLESAPLQWTVDKSDVVFERLILINILQRPYGELISRQGTCSILLFNLFGLSGSQTLTMLVITSILCSLFGAGFLVFLNYPFTNFTKKVVQINTVFLCLVLAGLLNALLRFWGLTLVFDGVALLTFTVGITETFISPKK